MDNVNVPVAYVSSRTEGDIVVGLLESQGVYARVNADDAGGQEPQLQLQGVQVLVAAADEAKAREILAEAEAGAEAEAESQYDGG